MQRFTIRGRFPSLNDYLRIKSSGQRAATKRDLDHRVMWAAKEAGIRPVRRYMLRVDWYEKDRRRDWDNVASGKKFILDGLKKAGVVVDDSQKYLLDTDDRYGHDSCDPRIEVFIYEEGDPEWRRR